MVGYEVDSFFSASPPPASVAGTYTILSQCTRRTELAEAVNPLIQNEVCAVPHSR
jgi:hypothetical protein